MPFACGEGDRLLWLQDNDRAYTLGAVKHLVCGILLGIGGIRMCILEGLGKVYCRLPAIGERHHQIRPVVGSEPYIHLHIISKGRQPFHQPFLQLPQLPAPFGEDHVGAVLVAVVGVGKVGAALFTVAVFKKPPAAVADKKVLSGVSTVKGIPFGAPFHSQCIYYIIFVFCYKH